MFLNHFLLGFLWLIYCSTHSILASFKVKKRMQELLGLNYKWYRISYVIFAFLFLVALIYFQLRMSTIVLFRTPVAIFWLGIILSVSGLLLMLICIKKYFISLSGLQSLLSEEKVSNTLMIKGVHRFVRHPLYLGTF